MWVGMRFWMWLANEVDADTYVCYVVLLTSFLPVSVQVCDILFYSFCCCGNKIKYVWVQSSSLSPEFCFLRMNSIA